MHLTIKAALSDHSKSLQAALSLDASTARIEVQCLLQSVLSVNRAYLIAHAEQILDDKQQQIYLALYQRRLQGEPIAYLLGVREFFGLNFKVTHATLIPRPDTELLVELALQRIPASMGMRILDLGTGSGAIALSIASERPASGVVAVDTSLEALRVAQQNQRELAIENVNFLQSDWFAVLGKQRFNVIVSNPPYIAEGDEHLRLGDVRYEPITALTAGPDGLDDIRCICAGAMQYLSKEGWLMLEHGYDQAEQVREILRLSGFQQIFSACDLSGIARVSGGQA